MFHWRKKRLRARTYQEQDSQGIHARNNDRVTLICCRHEIIRAIIASQHHVRRHGGRADDSVSMQCPRCKTPHTAT